MSKRRVTEAEWLHSDQAEQKLWRSSVSLDIYVREREHTNVAASRRRNVRDHQGQDDICKGKDSDAKVNL